MTDEERQEDIEQAHKESTEVSEEQIITVRAYVTKDYVVENDTLAGAKEQALAWFEEDSKYWDFDYLEVESVDDGR